MPTEKADQWKAYTQLLFPVTQTKIIVADISDIRVFLLIQTSQVGSYHLQHYILNTLSTVL